nr:MFS transporter [Microbacterium sp. NIBRBAC000506063]
MAAIAPTFSVFLVGRALQGVSYAINPMTIVIARSQLEPRRAQHGISTLSVTVAAGLGIGYPLTGVIAAFLDFRFAFWFAVVFALSAILVVAFIVPSGAELDLERRTFDYLGAVVLSVALGALLLGISEAPIWPLLATFATLSLSVIAFVVWVFVELRTEHPLVDLRLFRLPDVLLANVTAIALGTAMYIALSIVSLVAQAPTSTGYGIELPLAVAGLFILPLSAGSLAANRLVRIASRRTSMSSLVVVGSGMLAVSTVFLAVAHSELWEVLVGMLFFGLGVGATFAAMPAVIARRVASAELGGAVSFNQVLRTVGGSFGSAITSSVIAANLAPDRYPSSGGVVLALSAGAAICVAVLVALVASAGRSRR